MGDEVNKNNKGFGALGFIVVIMVLLVLGFGGWAVLRSQNSNTEKQETESAYSPVVPEGWVVPNLYDARNFVKYSVPASWNVPVDGFDVEIDVRPVYMGIKYGMGEPLLAKYINTEDVFRNVKLNADTGFYTEVGDLVGGTFTKTSVKAEDRYPTFTYRDLNMPTGSINTVVIKDDNMWIFSITNDRYLNDIESGYCSTKVVRYSDSYNSYCESVKISDEEWERLVPDFIRTIEFY